MRFSSRSRRMTFTKRAVALTGAALAAVTALTAAPAKAAEGPDLWVGPDGRAGMTTAPAASEAPPFAAAPNGATTLEMQAADGPANHRVIGLHVSAGLRGTRLASAGFDPFSTDDGFVQSSLAVAYRAIQAPRLDLSVGAEWDYGFASAWARDSHASLDVHELAVAVNARVPLSQHFAAFVRLTPGAARLEARLTDAAALPRAGYTSGALTQTRWLPSATASLGLAFRIASVSRSATALVFDYWLTAEAGYHYSPSTSLALRSEQAPAGGRTDEPLILGNLSLQGGFGRLGVALTF